MFATSASVTTVSPMIFTGSSATSLGSSIRLGIFTAMLPVPVSSEPAEISRLLRMKVAINCSAGISYASSCVGSMITSRSSERVPFMLASNTSGIASMSSRISMINSCNTRSEASSETRLTWITGQSDVDISLITGSFADSGKKGLARSTASRTSSNASSRSAEADISTKTVAALSEP